MPAEPKQTKIKILIIEDDPDIVELLEYNLGRDGFEVVTARDGELGIREAERCRPAVILLDLMLPRVDGLEVCRTLRSRPATKDVPIIMVTAKGEESDIVLGLGIGADDYVVKPFSPKTISARIRAVLRRSQFRGRDTDGNPINLGPISIDPARYEVTVEGEPVSMTRAEFRLLYTLASHRGRVLTRDQLLDKVTGGESIVIDRNVDVHIGAIRRKLGGYSDWIATVRGVGYKIRD